MSANVETGQNTTITAIQNRVDHLRRDAGQYAVCAGGNFSNFIWKGLFGGVGLANFIFPQLHEEFSKDANTGYVLLIFYGLSALALYGTGRDIFEGVHHLQIRRGIMGEITSLRSVLIRRYGEALNGHSAE